MDDGTFKKLAHLVLLEDYAVYQYGDQVLDQPMLDSLPFQRRGDYEPAYAFVQHVHLLFDTSLVHRIPPSFAYFLRLVI